MKHSKDIFQKISKYSIILFVDSLKENNEFTYHGDRTRDEIVKFALRLSGPPVQEITKSQSFDTIKKERDLYFLYVGVRSGPLWVGNYYFLIYFFN